MSSTLISERRALVGAVAMVLCFGVAGCGSSGKKPQPYFTSGSHEADQRAEQRIAQAQQARGQSDTGGGSKEKNAKGQEAPKSLYERLGGEQGIQAIVDDFVARALADPRVNWQRNGVNTGGFAGIGGHSIQWQPTPENVSKLKQHFAQFLAVATGGPTQYQGREITTVHKGMQITNAEFDATVGDLKSTLDKLGVATPQQRELLAVIESTRAQIVESR